MNGLLLTSAGLALSSFASAVFLVGRGRARDGRRYLSVVCLQAALLFLKDFVEQTGGQAWFVTFLIFANFLFGLPALHLFLQSTIGEPVERPVMHFLPSLGNLPAAALVSLSAIGSPGVDGTVAADAGLLTYLPIVYLNLLAAGETVQLVLYGRAGLKRTHGARGGRGQGERLIVIGVIGCYAVYYAVRWMGLALRVFAGRGSGLAALPGWVNAVSMGFVALFVALAGIYALTRGDSGRSAAAEPRVKYGGKPLGRKEAERIAERATRYLEACEDLSAQSPRHLAECLGVPYYLLSRAINEYQGRTVADLIRETRVERAKALLDSRPDASILRIALESGFPAKSSFNEAFKKTEGISPGEYRRRALPSGGLLGWKLPKTGRHQAQRARIEPEG